VSSDVTPSLDAEGCVQYTVLAATGSALFADLADIDSGSCDLADVDDRFDCGPMSYIQTKMHLSRLKETLLDNG